MIESKSNKYVKYAKSLYLSKNRKKYGQFIVEGNNLVEMAIKSNLVDYVLTTDNCFEGYEVSVEVMNSVVKTVNVAPNIAVCNYPKFENYHTNKVLILDDIQDPGNFGTLVRSALAFNFDLVVCSNNCVDLYNDKVVRSTGGALFFIPVIYTDLETYIKSSDNKVIGTFIDGVSKLDHLDKFSLVIGNEGHGISNEIRALCDFKYRIDINENIESLNAGVAGSILMHQLGVLNDK